LGQLLQVIPNIKHYILNLVPSKPSLLELTIASIAIDHQIAIIQVQVGKNFIEDVFLDGSLELISLRKAKGAIRSIKTKTYTLQSTYG
jgi:hypothetical protein